MPDHDAPTPDQPASPHTAGSHADFTPRPGEPRREFFKKAAAVVLGGLISLAPLAVGLAFLLDPILRRRKTPGRQKPKRDDLGFVRITTTDSLPADGRPQKFSVVADQMDAWNYFPEQRVGNVILRKTTDGAVESAADVAAFTDVCPHLGCTVDYKPDDNAFVCPCHASAFSVEGERTNQIPPRNMDKLAVDVRDGNEVWVKYQKFEVGKGAKTPIGV